MIELLLAGVNANLGMKGGRIMVINRKNTALLVVDIQGSLARTVEEANQLYSNWIKMVRVARLFDLPILVLEQYPEGLGGTIPELQVELENFPIYSKRTFSGYQDIDFRNALKSLDVDNLLVMGVEAHVCVFQTVSDILAHETFNIYVLGDGVSSRKAIDRDLAIRRLEKAGSIISTVETVAFELMQDSRDEKFKDFLKLIK